MRASGFTGSRMLWRKRAFSPAKRIPHGWTRSGPSMLMISPRASRSANAVRAWFSARFLRRPSLSRASL
eukprot:11184398-Lingulodinium_polyedra.AAC.1